ncbi:unnamed protein product [Phytophthora lilii]|uniref:Unnamed protein product n=1 Tax=Phytophthora lilii TaxID=2077276 RepID=A0A9W7CT75_9STRA|nr:unnamed protein product [Phytophthora lilii]
MKVCFNHCRDYTYAFCCKGVEHEVVLDRSKQIKQKDKVAVLVNERVVVLGNAHEGTHKLKLVLEQNQQLSSMDAAEYQDEVLQARMEFLHRQQERRVAAKLPENLMELQFCSSSTIRKLTFRSRWLRCHALTDEGLMTIRRHLSLLQELFVNECHHISSVVLCKVWKDCKRMHTLSVQGCPGVTDAFLQCIATTKRSSPACTLRSLNVRQCKNLTSSGISFLASSTVKDMAMHHLAIDDCLSVDNMAFFGFETSPGLRSLVSLSLNGLGIDETAISWIVKGCGGSLQRLNVERCKVLSDFALLLMAPLISSPVFVKLNMHGCLLITDVGIRNLFSLEEEKQQNAAQHDSDDDIPQAQLQSLSLKNCPNIGDDAMVQIGKHGGNLVKLNLKGLRKVSDRGVMEIARGCPSLTTISLSGRNITKQTFKLLGKMCRRLRVLDISERKDLETPVCFMNLVSTTGSGVHPPHPLIRIDLSSTNVCDIGVSVLASACCQLESINLSKCSQITDYATEALASRCFQLKVLLLANTRGITDRTLSALAFTKIPLEVLDLSGNTRVTDDGLLVLCTSCQQLQELRLKGCDRLSQKVVKRCNDNLLPFTKPFTTASLIKTIASGGGNAVMVLEPLPKRVYRGHMARRRVAFYRTLATNTAIIIQLQWRRYRARKMYLHQRGLIIHMQRMVRYARTVTQMRQIVRSAVAKHRNDAALNIQRCYRGMLGRKRVLLFRKIRRAKYARKGQNATQALLRRQFIHKGAALCIQQWIRGVLARRKVLKIRKWRRFLAVQRIQQYMKEWIRTLRLSRKREAKTHAATDIERVFRGHQGRLYFKAERHRQRCIQSAQLIQRIYRGRLGRKRFAQIFKAKTSAASLLQRIYRTRKARKLFEISKAVAALKAKEQYDRSLLGRLEARRNPMDELYRRAKLPREKKILTKLKEDWESHRTQEERAVRKLKRECAAVWANADEIIGNQYGVRRKLYGVTENVYATHRELEQRKKQHASLNEELAGLKSRVRAFKRAMREAVENRRMLEGLEVFDLLKEHGLFLEPDPPNNQRD